MVPSNETNISHSQPAFLEMILLFPRWDLLVSWRVIIIPFKRYCLKDPYYPLNKKNCQLLLPTPRPSLLRICSPLLLWQWARANLLGNTCLYMIIYVYVNVSYGFIWKYHLLFYGSPAKECFFSHAKSQETHIICFWKKQTAGEAFCWRSLEVAQVDWTFLFNIFLLNAGPTPDSESGVGLAKKKRVKPEPVLGNMQLQAQPSNWWIRPLHFCSSFPELMCFGRIVLCFWSRFIDIFFGNRQHFYPPKRRDDPHETQHGTWSHFRFCPLVSECIIVSKQCDQSYFTPQKQRQKVYLVSESCLKKGIPKHSTYGISTYAVAYVWC